MAETECVACSPATAVEEIDADGLALLCKALAHPARVQILKHLAKTGTCFFGSFSDVVPLAASTISQHVSILKEAGLIRGSADEQRMCYCVVPERLEILKQLIKRL